MIIKNCIFWLNFAYYYSRIICFYPGTNPLSDPLSNRENDGLYPVDIRFAKKIFSGYPDIKILNGDGFFYPDTNRIQTLISRMNYSQQIHNIITN